MRYSVDDFFLVFEISVETAFGDTGFFGNIANVKVIEPAFQNQCSRGIDKFLASFECCILPFAHF